MRSSVNYAACRGAWRKVSSQMQPGVHSVLFGLPAISRGLQQASSELLSEIRSHRHIKQPSSLQPPHLVSSLRLPTFLHLWNVFAGDQEASVPSGACFERISRRMTVERSASLEWAA